MSDMGFYLLRFHSFPSEVLVEMIPVAVRIFGAVKLLQAHALILTAEVIEGKRHGAMLTVRNFIQHDYTAPVPLALGAAITFDVRVTRPGLDAPPGLSIAHHLRAHIQTLLMAMDKGRADFCQLVRYASADGTRAMR